MNEVHHIGFVSKETKIRRALWNVVCVFLFRPFVTGLFRKWRILILNLAGAKISYKANVYASVKVWAPWNLEMADGACLGPDVICYNQDRVVLGKDVTVSQYSYLCTAGHETLCQNTAADGLITAEITLEDGAWIGTRAFVGMGVNVGKNAIVGATASVYKDVDENCIVGGNPAKIIRKR